MSYLFNADKKLIREAMELGGYSTQIEAVREALRVYVEKHRASLQSDANDGNPATSLSSRI
jgi:Arc/MetJ family transcription regulator